MKKTMLITEKQTGFSSLNPETEMKVLLDVPKQCIDLEKYNEFVTTIKPDRFRSIFGLKLKPAYQFHIDGSRYVASMLLTRPSTEQGSGKVIVSCALIEHDETLEELKEESERAKRLTKIFNFDKREADEQTQEAKKEAVSQMEKDVGKMFKELGF